MNDVIEAAVETGLETTINTAINTSNHKELSVIVKSDDQKSQDFSAGAGLFIVVALFFMFFMVPMATLISVALEINLLPIVIAIMSSSVIVATFYLVLRIFDTSFK